MPRETKSNGQKDIFDRFYTKEDVVNKCLTVLNLNDFDCIIEPSAGTGNFLKNLPADSNVFAYDIAPEADGIEKIDWFSVDKTQFNVFKSILVLGNPPFGQQNSLAIRFFNESAKFCNTIAFVLPLSFKKSSVQNRLDLNFHLIKEIDLDNCGFMLLDKQEVTVPCVFQIWERQDKPRKKIKGKITSTEFIFTDKENADFRIQRVGGNAGKAFFDLNKSASSNYFIKNNSKLSNEDFIELVNHLIFPSIEFTVGPKSLSKTELIEIIEENIK